MTDDVTDETLREWTVRHTKRDARDLVAFTVAFVVLVVAGEFAGFRPVVLTVLAMSLAGWFR